MIRNPLDIAVFNLFNETLTNPAPGANKVINFPTNSRSELVALSFTLTCDANAANRIIQIHFVDGIIAVILAGSAHFQTANEVKIYSAHGSQSHVAVDTTGRIGLPIPTSPVGIYPNTLLISIVDKQAGDQLSEISMIWKRWTIAP